MNDLAQKIFLTISVAAICGASAAVVKVYVNEAKIESQKEVIERIDDNVKSLHIKIDGMMLKTGGTK